MSEDDNMKLPESKTCKDCVSFASHCVKLFGCPPDNKTCDFAPSRFRQKRKRINDFSISELVSELRKRDGVEVVDVPESGQSNILAWSSQKILNHLDLIYDNEKNGKAIILRITD